MQFGTPDCVPAQHLDLHGDQTMFGWGSSWFSCFKLLVCNYKGTSSFMTSALDALVFVQVCVCVCILKYLACSMNTLLVYTMYSCFLAFDPDTSHVQRPIPNHVESIVSDFEV